jgi:LysM repeat protein
MPTATAAGTTAVTATHPGVGVTPTPVRANTPLVVPTRCVPRTDWPTYTVQGGETLFRIAQRANTTVAVLVAANCISNPETIRAGQVLSVPNALSTAEPVVYWTQTTTRSAGSVRVACDAMIAPVDSTIPHTRDAASNIRNSLSVLFTTGTGTTNLWAGQGLSVQRVTIDNAGQANIAITGGLTLAGTCADGVMLAQFLLSVFAESQVQTASITIDSQNMVQLFDTSGLEPADAVFTAADIPMME